MYNVLDISRYIINYSNNNNYIISNLNYKNYYILFKFIF